jgi:hypothetical protein
MPEEMLQPVTVAWTGVSSSTRQYARRILRTIFPNYPELEPSNPAPTLEPIAPSRVKAAL